MSKDFLTISVKLSENEVYNKNLDEDLRINKNNLQEEIMQQAGKYAWWATLYELASDKEARAKRDLEVLEATLYKAYRDELTKDGKKTTEKEIDTFVKLDPQYSKQKDAYMDSIKQASILGVAKDSFSQRKDMIRSLSMEKGTALDMEVIRNLVTEVVNNSR